MPTSTLKRSRNLQGSSQCESHLLAIPALPQKRKDFGERKTVHCPIPGHHDQSPSAVYFSRTRRFHCSVCTPGRAITLEELGRTLGQSVFSPTKFSSTEISGTSSGAPRSSAAALTTVHGTPNDFTARDAERAWNRALAQTRDDSRIGDPHTLAVHAYLAERGLAPAWDEALFGILTDAPDLPHAVRTWPRRGYTLVAPLHDASTGEIVNLQARAVRSDLRPKTLFPKGSQAQGTVFANRTAKALLRAKENFSTRNSSAGAVIVGEGLTDFLALAVHATVPVFSAPGAGATIGALGAWVRGRVVCLALDCDPAGEAAVSGASRAAFRFGARAVRRVEWPENSKDACDALRLLGEAGFRKWIDAFVGE